MVGATVSQPKFTLSARMSKLLRACYLGWDTLGAGSYSAPDLPRGICSPDGPALDGS